MTLLNPEYYSTKLYYLLGGGGKYEDATAVTVADADVWTYDEESHTYAQADATNLAAELTADGETCTCSNYLREISYAVRLEAAEADSANTGQGSKYYGIASISATVVLGATPLTAGSCGKTRAEDREPVAVNQKYSIAFTTADPAAAQPQKVSGSPGYIDGYPLKVGYLEEADTEAGAPIQTYEAGFEISGADAAGGCLTAEDAVDPALTDYGDFVLKFKEDHSYGCSVQHSKASLADFCAGAAADSTGVSGLPIFANLLQFAKYGKFGNADLYYPSDWVDVREDESFAKLGSAEWDEGTETCTVWSTVLIRVIYHKMGLSGNLQQYVVDVQKYAVPEEWKYPPQAPVSRNTPGGEEEWKVDFNHFVVVQYVELPDAGAGEEGLLPVPPIGISREMFYPAFLRS